MPPRQSVRRGADEHARPERHPLPARVDVGGHPQVVPRFGEVGADDAGLAHQPDGPALRPAGEEGDLELFGVREQVPQPAAGEVLQPHLGARPVRRVPGVGPQPCGQAVHREELAQQPLALTGDLAGRVPVLELRPRDPAADPVAPVVSDHGADEDARPRYLLGRPASFGHELELQGQLRLLCDGPARQPLDQRFQRLLPAPGSLCPACSRLDARGRGPQALWTRGAARRA